MPSRSSVAVSVTLVIFLMSGENPCSFLPVLHVRDYPIPIVYVIAVVPVLLRLVELAAAGSAVAGARARPAEPDQDVVHVRVVGLADVGIEGVVTVVCMDN
ncbi:hypothetical protein NUU61_000163 [Penicillium alfredii]|uniref:Uncharacterized protein n=1 Tax=Penicillium alfredii TaxID=1506179 RepID=A0A9W9KPH3_9EURO|nr:uncharacterized protein NUU61_000163 [Penicillium alfredii]KAJ5114404.1 hypothetical protein NUU61_000163 [Penicillium alfredii]